MKWVLLRQPKILSKVIPLFETKLGSGRLFLRWTTQQSQVQFFEESAEFEQGGNLLAIRAITAWMQLPVRTCSRAKANR